MISHVLTPLAAIFKKQVRHQLRYPGEFIFVFIIPYFLTALVYAMGNFVGGSNASDNFAVKSGSSLPPFVFQIVGAGVWMISWVIIEDIGNSLRNEQIKGTLEQNFLAPVNRFLFLVGTALSQIVVSTLVFIGVIAGSIILLYPAGAPHLTLAFLILLVGLVPLFGLGFLFAALVIRFKEPSAFTQAVNLLFGVLIGTYYTVSLLPGWVQAVSYSIPLTHVISDMRLLLDPAKEIASVGPSLLALLVMVAVYPMAGYLFFKVFERRAKVTGDLSKY